MLPTPEEYIKQNGNDSHVLNSDLKIYIERIMLLEELGKAIEVQIENNKKGKKYA